MEQLLIARGRSFCQPRNGRLFLTGSRHYTLGSRRSLSEARLHVAIFVQRLRTSTDDELSEHSIMQFEPLDGPTTGVPKSACSLRELGRLARAGEPSTRLILKASPGQPTLRTGQAQPSNACQRKRQAYGQRKRSRSNFNQRGKRRQDAR
jgi:hypothetical protein